MVDWQRKIYEAISSGKKMIVQWPRAYGKTAMQNALREEYTDAWLRSMCLPKLVEAVKGVREGGAEYTMTVDPKSIQIYLGDVVVILPRDYVDHLKNHKPPNHFDPYPGDRGFEVIGED